VSRQTSDTIVVLTEVALDADDASRIVALHEGESLTYRVLIPQDAKRNLLVDVLDHLSLLDLRKVIDDLRPRSAAGSAAADAENRLAGTLAALRGRGVRAEGATTAGDPLLALGETVSLYDAREVVVVTRPHAVEDTFHTDWASVARKVLGVPVLHVYGGTSFVR
jgi:hypothetical protein